MMSKRENRLNVRTGRSLLKDEREAVREFLQAVQQPAAQAVIFFCSSRYNLNILGAELAKSFDCPLIGCTSAGEISTRGYQEWGIVGASLSSSQLRIHRNVISPLSRFSLTDAEKMAAAVRTNLSLVKGLDRKRMFGLILIDGLSLIEEAIITSLYSSFEGISIIGGSAGDDLEFRKTFVYDDGRFLSDAAIFSVFETTLPFLTFETQHFQPTETKIVITGADPARRIISEINGEPAAQEYARVLGLKENLLNPAVFSENPLLLRIGGEWYVRAIARVNDDGTLSLFSAIEEGLVLTIGKGVDIVRNLENHLSKLEEKVPGNRFFLLCDCILRKLEFKSRDVVGEINGLLGRINAVGFSTYGEQYNSIHVNQTLTGIVIGG